MSESIAVVSNGVSSGVSTWREVLIKRYFLAASIVMLAILVVGFAPTLLFRPAFKVPPIPMYLFVHGAVLFAWFVWFFFQTALVAIHRTDLHRRSGIVGVLIATCVVAVSVFTIVSYLPRMREMGTDFAAEGTRLAAGIVGDCLMLVQFIPIVARAVLWRSRPEIHKRLMFLASLAILGPAGSRLPATFGALGLTPVAAPFVAFIVFTVGAPIVYDVLTRRRLHIATIVCVLANVGGVVAGFMIAGNQTAREFILNAL
ncbi:MAG: hypothetical protein ABI640_08415 [Gammaproteobacteria bacterium]